MGFIYKQWFTIGSLAMPYKTMKDSTNGVTGTWCTNISLLPVKLFNESKQF